MFGDADPIVYGQRRMLCKDRCAGIALFFGVIPMLFVTFQIKVDLTLLQFALLNTEYIRVKLFERIEKTFFDTGAQAIDIP